MATTAHTGLSVIEPDGLQADEGFGGPNPFQAYLARLSPGARPAIITALITLARLFFRERCAHPAVDKTPRPAGRVVWSRVVCDLCNPFTFEWAKLRPEDTSRLRAAVAERYAPATGNVMLSALRGVLKEAWRLRLMPIEEYHRAIDLPRIRGKRLPKGRSISALEIRSLFEVCLQDQSAAGRRDAAIVSVLYGAGLRRAEATKLEVNDIDFEAGTIRVRSGKGNKERLVPPMPGTLDFIADWLALRGTTPGGLFAPINKGGTIDVRPMGSNALFVAVQKRARQARIAKPLSPHDFRRTFAGDLLDSGADLSTVQRILGHASPTTTGIYDRRPEQAKKAATARINTLAAIHGDAA